MLKNKGYSFHCKLKSENTFYLQHFILRQFICFFTRANVDDFTTLLKYAREVANDLSYLYKRKL